MSKIVINSLAAIGASCVGMFAYDGARFGWPFTRSIFANTTIDTSELSYQEHKKHLDQLRLTAKTVSPRIKNGRRVIEVVHGVDFLPNATNNTLKAPWRPWH